MKTDHAMISILLALLPVFFLAEITLVFAGDAGTGIEGMITVGPVHGGPSKIGVSDSTPLTNATFVAENQNGASTSFTTDDQGRFHLSLEPGHYTISLKDKKGGIGYYGPFEVDVIAGQMTKVEWRCDTGMR